MAPINLDLSVKECLDSYPQSLPVFQSFGFHDFDSPQVQEKLGPFLKLRTLLKFKNIDADTFLDRINTAVVTSESPTPTTAADIHTAQPTLLALLPCGLKVSLNNALQSFAEELAANKTPLAYLAEGNVNHELSYYPYIDSVESVDELPDLILSSDINAFYHHRFVERFVEPGHFVSVNGPMAPHMQDVDFADPRGHYTMFCGNALVLVHVKDVRPELEAPKAWQDLLEEKYNKSIIMRGQEDFFCSGVLVPFYRLFGSEAIPKLAASVCDGMHPSQMVKMIDTRSDNCPPFFIMPWFFAHKIKAKERIDILFPEEGAFISPVQLLVKKEKREALSTVVDFLMSRSLHQHCSDNFFPSPHPEVVPNLPEGKKLFWIGWDFIYTNDLEQVKSEIGATFTKEYLRTGGG
ncbi:ABC transporter substrate-binding protein [Desulfobulbus rhabdoformis]|uniref:ABC transporter substrate-binding protein n=1 Tax=Desulfobulbus rhabdoformis TaxID=34032 RepID=UPI001965E368|nr:ABC transporter substrate-binding protein [Desulfobulbus rhabdoformis]MBM9616815.1 ABC transporter substrate-binding protein [Desulfobulbus rhabdoformis]